MSYVPPPSTSRADVEARLRFGPELNGQALPVGESAESFHVRVIWPKDLVRGTLNRGEGTLVVSDSRLTFVPSEKTRYAMSSEVFEHMKSRVTITTARLRPPWANTYLVLQGKRSWMQVIAPASVRRRLEQQLARAGIEVESETTSGRPPLPGW